jgi:hypothetical protein
MAAKSYLYYNGTTTLQNTTDPANIGGTHTLVAVAQNGADLASIQVVGGGTYISGDWINTGTVTATQIKANTILATNLSMNIGGFLFDAADGLLLLGPGCEISDSEWWSQRKQKATITGAFHQEMGRWQGARALVVEKATTNLVVNPSFETNLTSWTLVDADASVTRTRSTEQSRYGSYSVKMVNTDAGDDDHNRITFAASASTAYTITAWVRVTTFTAGAQSNRGLGVYDGTNFEITTITAANEQWERHEITLTTAVGASSLEIRLYAPQGTVYWDGVQVEQSAYATTYCDGSLGHDYTWSGSAHGSTSTRATTQVNLDAYAGLLDSNTTWSVAFWAQMPYDYDAEWPQVSNYLFTTWEDIDNRTPFVYRTDTNELKCYYREGGVEVASGYQLQFSAGDWVQLVWAVNTAGNQQLFVNGILRDTDDISARGNITPTQMNLGTNSAGTDAGCFTFAEFAIFDKVLSAAEVAAMFALQRPLVDAGSMDTPGIYILDGKFKIASSLTGAHIEISADEIAGYSDATTKEFYIRASDGKAVFGGGAGIIDADGVRLIGTGAVDNARRILFQDNTSGDRTMGWIGADWGGGGGDPAVTWLIATRDAGDPWPADVQVQIAAIDTVAGTDVRLEIHSDGNYYMDGGDVSMDGGNVTMNGGNVTISTGRLSVGAALSDDGLKVALNSDTHFAASFFHDGDALTRYGIAIQCGDDDASTAGTAYPLQFFDGDGTACGGIIVSAGTAAIYQSSDRRNKRNICPTTCNGLETITALPVKDFQWLENKMASSIQTGFIAQDVEEIVPGAVAELDGRKVLSQTRFIPMIVKAIQEIAVRLDTLDRRLTL